MSKRVLVIGSINVDYVIHTERLPKLGETLTGSDFAMNFGGKGANQAVALARAGCEVRMLGAVGKDLCGELALNNLTASGVDVSSVLRVDAPTGAAVITVCGGDNHIILDVGANACVTPKVIEDSRDLLAWADTVVMQYEIPVESVLVAARMSHEMGKRVVINPAPVKSVDRELYRYADFFVPNEFEAELITGIKQETDEDAVRAAEALRSLGCKDVVITLGERGSAYTRGNGVAFQGIYKVERVDTTAAGDSFIGGLCAGLCEELPLEVAVDYAAAVSAITVSRAGAAVSIPTEDEVRTFLQSRNGGATT